MRISAEQGVVGSRMAARGRHAHAADGGFGGGVGWRRRGHGTRNVEGIRVVAPFDRLRAATLRARRGGKRGGGSVAAGGGDEFEDSAEAVVAAEASLVKRGAGEGFPGV